MHFIVGVIAFVVCYFLGRKLAPLFDKYLADRYGVNPQYEAETPIERIKRVHYD